MKDDLRDDASMLLHVVWELAHHGNDELRKTWNQELHVFVPVAGLENRLEQLFIQWTDLI